MSKLKKFFAVLLAAAMIGACLAACNGNKTVVAMQIGTLPEKLEYVEGELFDPTGLVLLVKYTDGSTAAIENGYTWDLTEPLEEDDDEVVVSYGGKSKIIEIEVEMIKPVSIEVSGNPKTVYDVGERFDMTGMTVTATYEDGTIETVTEGFRISPTTKLTTDVKFVTVTYKRVKTELPITVNAARAIGLVVDNEPIKTVYNEGEYFEIAGLAVSVSYSDGTSTRVSDYDYSPKTALTTDDKKIVISYGGLTVEQPITVNRLEIKLSVTTEPDKKEYSVGENFDPSGMVVTLIENDAPKTLDASEYEIVGGNDLSLGATISVVLKTNGNISARVPITVKQMIDIKKTDHCEGACDTQTRADLVVDAVGKDYVSNFVKGSKIKFTVNSDSTGKAELILRTASTYVTQYGTNIYWPVSTGDVQVNKLFKVKINGVDLTIGDDVIIHGSTTDNPTGETALLVDWKDIVIPNVDLLKDENIVEIEFLEQIYKNADVLNADGSVQKEGVLSSPVVDTFSVVFTN